MILKTTFPSRKISQGKKGGGIEILIGDTIFRCNRQQTAIQFINKKLVYLLFLNDVATICQLKKIKRITTTTKNPHSNNCNKKYSICAIKQSKKQYLRYQISRTVTGLRFYWQAKKLAYYCFNDASRRQETHGSETKAQITLGIASNMGSIFLSVLLTPKSYGDNAMSPEDTCTSGVLLSERNLWSRACYIFFFNSQIIYSKFSYKKGNYPIFYIQNNFDTGEKKEGLLWSLGKHLKSRLELLVGLLSQSKT